MRGILKIVAAGDFHFGNPKLGAEQLYHKCRKYIYPELQDAELCILTGDIYDQLLTVNSKAHRYACMFISDLQTISANTGMQIRILHGTYTHDRDQLGAFELTQVPNSRLRVIDTISAEEITDIRCGMDQYNRTLRVAYLPDNLPYKESSGAIEHLQRTLTCMGWQSVDLLVGHGSFEHVMRMDSEHKPPCLYRIDQFTNLVHGPIVMGHIHTPGRTKNVVYCGSFDRMAHNEEESKGFYVLTRDQSGKEGWKNRFVSNEDANLFISIKPEGTDPGMISKDFCKKVEERFPEECGHVRVLHESPEIRSLLHKVCSGQFPDIVYSSKAIGEKEKVALQISDVKLDIFDDVKPDVHNLGALVWQFLGERGLNNDVQEEEIVGKVNELLTI